MKSLENIKLSVLSFQQELLRDLQSYVIKKEDFLNPDNWYFYSDDILIYNQNKKMYISSEIKDSTYLSFLEKNTSFSVMPQIELTVLPNEEFEVTIKGTVFGDINPTFYLIEYSDKGQLAIHPINLNKQTIIKTTAYSKKIRFAIKLSKNGIIILENFSLKRVNDITESVNTNSFTSVVKRNRPNKISDVKMGCIFDEFSTTCFQEDVNLITFTPENWLEILTNDQPDVLMVESAWRGNNGTWEYKIAKYNNQDKSSLIQLTNWCKQNKIPTIFWNKEDPIHFDKFIDTAKLFDYVFTTDANIIEQYQEKCGHKNVYALPFAAQPKLHNPIKIVEKRIEKVSFAGSYYGNRHHERRKDMEEILDIAAEVGLDIYDRNYEKSKDKITDFSFPERFSDNVKGSLKYDEIDKAYKGYKVMLNVNSVKNSPTMFSRRVFEGLASGTPIISSFSEGIEKMFKDIVLVSENKEELSYNLKKLLDNEEFYRQKSLEGIREVFLNHTYKHRIQYIFEKVGLNVAINKPSVSVISVVSSKSEFKYVLKMFNEQTLPEKELIIFLDSFDGYVELLNNFNTPKVKTFVKSYMNHYSRFNEIVNSNYISYFSPTNFYGEHYLLDLLIASEYSQSDIVGKSHFYSSSSNSNLKECNEGHEYEYVSRLYFDCSIINLNVLNGEDVITTLNQMKICDPLDKYFKKGYRLFSIDKYNYIKSGSMALETLKENIEK